MHGIQPGRGWEVQLAALEGTKDALGALKTQCKEALAASLVVEFNLGWPPSNSADAAANAMDTDAAKADRQDSGGRPVVLVEEIAEKVSTCLCGSNVVGVRLAGVAALDGLLQLPGMAVVVGGQQHVVTALESAKAVEKHSEVLAGMQQMLRKIPQSK